MEQPFRAELVARVRREIAEGCYDTPEKLEAALERMFCSIEAIPPDEPPPIAPPKRPGKRR